MYDYQNIRDQIFTDRGQRDYLRIWKHVEKMLAKTGAFRMKEIQDAPVSLGKNGGWYRMALVDRMVELGEIRELTPTGTSGQDRVFVTTKS